jgi:hypothetical protein
MPAMVSTGFSCETDWKWPKTVLTGLECLQWFQMVLTGLECLQWLQLVSLVKLIGNAFKWLKL